MLANKVDAGGVRKCYDVSSSNRYEFFKRRSYFVDRFSRRSEKTDKTIYTFSVQYDILNLLPGNVSAERKICARIVYFYDVNQCSDDFYIVL